MTSRSPWAQAATIIVLFSFLVQSLGAADLAMLMRQPAGAFMPPPVAAARIAAFPRPISLPPAAKAAPKGPSLWARIAKKSQPLGQELLARTKASLYKAVAAWDELWALPEPAALAPVNLASVPPDRTGAGAGAEDRMLVVPEDVPEPAEAPQSEAMPQSPREVVETPPQPVNDRRNLFRYPRLRPVAWLSDFRGRGARASGISHSQSVMPRLDGRWIDGHGLRYRVNYLNPKGFSRASGQGVEYMERGRRMLNRGEVLPRKLWDTYAIYAHGDTVDYEVEIQNTAEEPLHDVAVLVSEEVLNRQGGAGQPLNPAQLLRLQGTLAPGRGTKLRGSFPIVINWVFQGSFEQTHVRVSAKTGAEAQPTVRGEAYQAGVIDPPPEDEN
ncbi:MAG: hypothetical protein HY926_03355 [Elusimicrobia bacterium]|nr:hypothetical protein [Elusimicrobiota bacterium]